MSNIENHSELKKGVVSEVYPKMCNVLIDEPLASAQTDGSVHLSEQKLLCTYRRAKVINKEAEWLERSPVSPGDWVEVKVLGSKDGVIESILPRKNSIHRRAPGKDGKVLHTIAANVDLVVIVTSLLDPKFSPGLVDRFLIATMKAEITPLLVINKIDLAEEAMTAAAGSSARAIDEAANFDDHPWKIYEDLGIRCIPISAKNSVGIDDVRAHTQGRTSVFCGHSGVGKTSLLSALFGESMGRVGEVNRFTRKGKHTTTVSTLMVAQDGTRFIDTPGIKEFGLVNITHKEVIEFFPEIYAAQQKREPIEGFARYESYSRIKAALEDEGR